MFLLVLFRKWATILVHATADYPCMEIGFPWLNQLPSLGGLSLNMVWRWLSLLAAMENKHGRKVTKICRLYSPVLKI